MSLIVRSASSRFLAYALAFSFRFSAAALSFSACWAASSISKSWRSLRPSLSIFFSASICSRSFLRRSRLSLEAIFCNAAYSFCVLLKRPSASLLMAFDLATSKSVVSLPAAFALAISMSYASDIFSARFLELSAALSFALPSFSAFSWAAKFESPISSVNLLNASIKALIGAIKILNAFSSKPILPKKVTKATTSPAIMAANKNKGLASI